MIQKLTLKKDQKGFTLIELMIVIAIIGILAAIAVPQFLTYRQRSYNSAAKAVVHNLKADNGNLNADLGIYGHTEAAAALLTAADGGAGVADTQAVPGLATSALGGAVGAAGARIMGTTAVPAVGVARSLGIGTSLGNNMIAQMVNTNMPNNLSNFHAYARHYKGDVAYGIDSDIENVLFMCANPTWVNTNGLGALPAPVIWPPANDLDGFAGGGQPTGAWTRYTD